ncbi:hypothetical protein [Nocardia panacis]|uniref:hypothetical protein n=1 Tax=Nocardia panacis TaxID=2340916 RepID=UPI00193A2760|nr:hypothetical protein [Nocardia panacis]
MSIRTRVEAAPGRVARRAKAADKVKTGAAQRAYARRKLRAEQSGDGPALRTRTGSRMATRIPFVAAILALLGCGLALTLLLTTRAAEDSYQLSDARATNRKLSEERAALQREVEMADSAPELAAKARELGMIPAKDPARLVIAPDGAITVVGKPTPAQGAPVPPLNVSPTAPAAPQTGNAQARGERVVPVPKPPTPQPNPAQPSNPAANSVAVQAAQSAPAVPGPAANAALPPVNPAQPQANSTQAAANQPQRPVNPAHPPVNSAAAPLPANAAQPAPAPLNPGLAPAQANSPLLAANPPAGPAVPADPAADSTAPQAAVPAPNPARPAGAAQ